MTGDLATVGMDKAEALSFPWSLPAETQQLGLCTCRWDSKRRGAISRGEDWVRALLAMENVSWCSVRREQAL